ncbi:GIY-YIG nuclease family protein [Acidianus infernus]|uniref:GIY-YIG nuclease family protein n=1 Tax=Acidianus infernus TaxID=12915 RepID=UPI003594779B
MIRYKGYVAFFYCDKDVNIIVNRKNKFELKKGYYAYVGSCGLHCDKRISRHISGEEKMKKHWHVDYISSICIPLGVIVLPLSEKEIVSRLSSLPGIKGFGNTDDKTSLTHLFRSSIEEVMERIFLS